LPEGALCPVPGAPGRLLRADAAAALRRLAGAYGADTGRVLCVADAYRSYDEQVLVKAARGVWAATPGRSNHGWGTAVDLCGGAESFDSPAFAWLVVHAPLYGWFHPAWAARGGRLPEPWHWEFAGG
jgi:LAS superfamily LD-carboxypeptidase LdcB